MTGHAPPKVWLADRSQIAQEASIGLQRLRLANRDTGEIPMAWIEQDVALSRNHGAGHVQHR